MRNGNKCVWMLVGGLWFATMAGAVADRDARTGVESRAVEAAPLAAGPGRVELWLEQLREMFSTIWGESRGIIVPFGSGGGTETVTTAEPLDQATSDGGASEE